MNEDELRARVRSLNVLIALVSREIMRQVWSPSRESNGSLLRQMEEALDELRWQRGCGKMLLTAFEAAGETEAQLLTRTRRVPISPRSTGSGKRGSSYTV